MIIFNTLIIMNAIDILPKEIWFHILDYIDDNKTFNQLPFVCQLFNQYYINSNKIHIKLFGNIIQIYNDIIHESDDIDNDEFIIGKIDIDIKEYDKDYILIYINDFKYNLSYRNLLIYSIKINMSCRMYELIIYDKCIINNSIDELFERIKLMEKLIVNYHKDIFDIFCKKIIELCNIYTIPKNYIFKN